MNTDSQPLITNETDENGMSTKNGGQVRHIGLVDGIALVLGIQIGSGVFSSPSLVLRNTESEPVALLIWILGGLLAWTCAAGYIELGIRVPHNGGPQEYLSYCFNDTCGFVASWGIIFIVKPCATAMLSLVIAEYMCNTFYVGGTQPEFLVRVVALLLISAVSAINCFSNHASDITTKIALSCKILGISVLVVAGFGSFLFRGGRGHSTADHVSTKQSSTHSYTDAMLSAIWAYSGWETLAFVGGELRDPSRNTSRVINISMTIVLVIFSVINLAYFTLLTESEIVSSDTIALTFSKRLFGANGAIFYTLVISLATVGTLNGKIFVAGRLTHAAAERGYLPVLLRKLNGTRSLAHGTQNRSEGNARSEVEGKGLVPLRAILFNVALATIYVYFGKFQSLVIFIGVAECAITFAAISGLLYLRFQSGQFTQLGEDQRGVLSTTASPIYFRAPIFLVLLALVASGFLVVSSVAKHPLTLLGLAGFCVAGATFHRYVIL